MKTTTTQHTPEPWCYGVNAIGIPAIWGGPKLDIMLLQLGEGMDDDREWFKDAAKNGERIVACVNACAGLADPAADLAALREALAFALTWAQEQYAIEQSKPDNSANIELLHDITNQARAALARVQGKED